jgi:hypothetical protein
VRTTPAQIGVESRPDLTVAWIGAAVEESLRLQDHPGGAIAALSSLLIDERLLQLPRFVSVAETFECRHRTPGSSRGSRQARPDRLPVNEHSAGAALRSAATEFRSVDPTIIDKHIEQKRVVSHVHADVSAIQTEVYHVPSSRAVFIVLAQQISLRRKTDLPYKSR